MSVFVESFPYPGNQSYIQLTKQKVEKPVHNKIYTAEEVDELIKNAISQGINQTLVAVSTTFSGLPTPSKSDLGKIYNIKDNFTTDDRFIEGAGKMYPKGANVIIVEDDGKYKFDVFMGEITPTDEASIQDIIDDIYKDE